MRRWLYSDEETEAIRRYFVVEIRAGASAECKKFLSLHNFVARTAKNVQDKVRNLVKAGVSGEV